MLTEELKEKKQKMLRLVRDEVDHIIKNHRLSLLYMERLVEEALVLLQSEKYDDKVFFDKVYPIIKNYPVFLPEVGNFVVEALVLLQSEKHQEAWSALWTAYQCLLPAIEVNYLYRFAPEPILEKVKNELIILDLGLFAYRLEGSFLQLHDVVPYLWDKRKNFYPHLASALRATYWFLCLIEAGREVEEAIHIALRVRNELHDAFGDVFYYHQKNISELLAPDALATLRQILLDIYSKRQGGKR